LPREVLLPRKTTFSARPLATHAIRALDWIFQRPIFKSLD
jgi:hypothetical protein